MLLSDHDFVEQRELCVLPDAEFETMDAPFVIDDLDESAESRIESAPGNDLYPGDLTSVFEEGSPVSESVVLKGVVCDGRHIPPGIDGPGYLNDIRIEGDHSGICQPVAITGTADPRREDTYCLLVRRFDRQPGKGF